MDSFKRPDKKTRYRLSDRDSGYEDLPLTSRQDGSFENIPKTKAIPSFSEWKPPKRIQSQSKMNVIGEIGESKVYAKRPIADEKRKKEVDAGKIGVSHMIRQWNSKIRENELPNLKPAIKTSKVILTETEHPVPLRKTRGKRRSKSADGRPVRQVSMFNPFYTKILSPREIEERNKWAERLRMDAILDEEYYKLPYEEINKEIALGRYSRSEPRLNWKRKQRKRVSFSTDIEQKEEKQSEQKSPDGDWNWKEDSGFHEMDVSTLKPIVKGSCTSDTSFDDSNVFTDEETVSDSQSSESLNEDESNELDVPKESELQSLFHLIKNQEINRSNERNTGQTLHSENPTNYIKELVLNQNILPHIPKPKTRIIPSAFKSNLKENKCSQSRVQFSQHPVTENDSVKHGAHENVRTSNATSKEPSGLVRRGILINDSTANDIGRNAEFDATSRNSIPSRKQPAPQKVTATIHTGENTIQKGFSSSITAEENNNSYFVTKKPEKERDITLTSHDQSGGIYEVSDSATRSKLGSQDEINKTSSDKQGTSVGNISENIEETRKRFFEIVPKPVTTIPPAQWHTDFIDYEAQSPINQSADDKLNHPERAVRLITNVGGRIKSPSRPSKLISTGDGTKVIKGMSSHKVQSSSSNITNVQMQTATQSSPTSSMKVTNLDTLTKPLLSPLKFPKTNVIDSHIETSASSPRPYNPNYVDKSLVIPPSPLNLTAAIPLGEPIKSTPMPQKSPLLHATDKSIKSHSIPSNQSPKTNSTGEKSKSQSPTRSPKLNSADGTSKAPPTPPNESHKTNYKVKSNKPESQPKSHILPDMNAKIPLSPSNQSPKSTYFDKRSESQSPTRSPKLNSADGTSKAPPIPPNESHKTNYKAKSNKPESQPKSHILPDMNAKVPLSPSNQSPKSTYFDKKSESQSPPRSLKLNSTDMTNKPPTITHNQSRKTNYKDVSNIPESRPESPKHNSSEITTKVPLSLHNQSPKSTYLDGKNAPGSPPKSPSLHLLDETTVGSRSKQSAKINFLYGNRETRSAPKSHNTNIDDLLHQPKSPKDIKLDNRDTVISSNTRSSKINNRDERPKIPPMKEDSNNREKIKVIVNEGPQVKEIIIDKYTLTGELSEEKLNCINSSKNKDAENVKNNNNILKNEPSTIHTIPGTDIYGIGGDSAFSEDISKTATTNIDNLIKLNKKNTDALRYDKIELGMENLNNSNNLSSSYNPGNGNIIKKKLILEDDFFCETDNSEEPRVTDTPDSTEAESEEDLTDSSGESSASYNIEEESHEVSSYDSPNQDHCNVNEHHEYFKEEGQSEKTTDKENAMVKSIVRRKVEETITDIMNVTSVISPDRRSFDESKVDPKTKGSALNFDTNNSLKPESTNGNIDPFILEGSHALPNKKLESSKEGKTGITGHQRPPPSPRTAPLALPRKSLLNGESNRKQPKVSKRSNHIIKTKDDQKVLQSISQQESHEKSDKKVDNLAKIKEAFIKAGLNPNVFDDLDKFDKQNSLSLSDFRENFVNMFMTKELDFTDYNIHLRTKTNSDTPNCTVTRKYLPLSIINEQMTWMKQTQGDKPVYTCHIASSNENIHKAALSLSKAPISGTSSPEDCYEYNDRDESPIDNKTTSPTPSWAESSSSGCFSASCSPTPHPTAGKSVPMPTTL